METNLTPDRTVPARINVNRITARLSDVTFEERFLDWRREHDLRRIRLVAVLSFPVSAIFAVLDWQVISENLDLALAIRAGMCVIGASVAYAMTLVDFFRRRLNLINWLIIGFTTLCYAVLNSVSDTPDEYLSGYILVLMFLYFLLPAGYLMSVAIGITCTIVFAVLIPLTRAIESGQLLTIYSQYVVTIVAGSFAVYQINVLRRHEFLNELQIAHQNRQYFDLLTRILPRSIVERMENGEKQIADSVPEAVVLFADVVSFTEMAAQNRPEVVVTTLNRLFEKFDACVAAHRLEKIKTIGDAYMVAGGIPLRSSITPIRR
jgi:adenylate cyclase